MDKQIAKYARMYRSAIRRRGLADIDEKTRAYIAKLTALRTAEAYRRHDQYPTIDTLKVYAVIAMCLMLREYGLTDDEVIHTVNDAFRVPKRLFYCLEKLIDCFPAAWNIAKKWNLNDHTRRVQDGSITYDYFTAEDDHISYRISRCMYVEMFAEYGIRPLCKIFCMSDTMAYANLTRHVRFVRRSDLSDGPSCQDDVYKC